MIERGRAIPNTQSVPIVNDRPQRSTDHITIIDGRVSSNHLISMEMYIKFIIIWAMTCILRRKSQTKLFGEMFIIKDLTFAPIQIKKKLFLNKMT